MTCPNADLITSYDSSFSALYMETTTTEIKYIIHYSTTDRGSMDCCLVVIFFHQMKSFSLRNLFRLSRKKAFLVYDKSSSTRGVMQRFENVSIYFRPLRITDCAYRPIWKGQKKQNNDPGNSTVTQMRCTSHFF